MNTTRTGQRIGLVDYELDNFHANTFLDLLRGRLAERGFIVSGATAVDVTGGETWCRQKEVPWYATVAELDPHVDQFLILAPGNPEVHQQLCKAVFPFGKTTFVDKTFAPDRATADTIFALADEHNIAIQTTSALRYTSVQKLVASEKEKVKHIYTWAGGDSFAEYGIHPVELLVSCFGDQADSILQQVDDTSRQILIRWSEGRMGCIDFAEGTHVPYLAAVTTEETTHLVTIDLTNLFRDALSAILDFFETGKPSIPRSESMLVRRILDAAGTGETANAFRPIPG